MIRQYVIDDYVNINAVKFEGTEESRLEIENFIEGAVIITFDSLQGICALLNIPQFSGSSVVRTGDYIVQEPFNNSFIVVSGDRFEDMTYGLC